MVPQTLLRRALVCLALSFIFTFVGLVGSAEAQGTVTGTIRSTASGNPTLQGVTVQLVSTQNGFVQRQASTGSNGVYSINTVTAGNYYIKTSNGAGFVDQIVTGTNGQPTSGSPSTNRGDCVGCIVTANNSVSSAGPGQPVSVSSGTVTADFFLTSGPSITGTVSGGGSLKQGANVTFFTSAGVTVGTSQTNASGAYTSPGLVNGQSYFIKTTNVTGFVDGVYNNGSTVNCLSCSVTSTGSTVATGSTNVNFALNAGFTIAGRITQSDGTTGIGGAQVTFYNSSGSNIGGTQSSTSGTVGSYTSSTFPAGDYYVGTTTFNSQFVNQVYSGKNFAGTSPQASFVTTGTKITISNANITGINLALTAGGTISGTVNGPNNSFPSSGSVAVYNATTGSQLTSAQINTTTGAYSLTGLPAGSYKLGTSNTNFVNQIYNGKQFNGFAQTSFILTGDSVQVQASVTTTINFTLGASASISGTITSSGNPVSGINVQLVDSNNSFVTSQTTGSSGTFTFSGLIPGNFAIKTQNSGGVGAGYIDKAYTSSPAGGVNCNSSCNATQIANAVFTAAAGANTGKDISLVVGGKISGKVTQDGGGNGPLQSIQLQAYDSAQQFGQFLGSATTAADGTYTIAGLATGSYTVKTNNSAGYLDKLYNNIPCTSCNTSAGQALTVNAGGGNDQININFALVQGGTIKGKVKKASDSSGVGFVQVDFYDSKGTRVGGTQSSNQNATLGDYTSPGLATGTYFVVTTGSNSAGLINKLYETLDCLGCTNAPPGGGVSQVVNGKPVSVTAGQSTTGIDLAMNAGLSIAGTVTDKSTTLPIGSVRVQIYTSASGNSSVTSTTTAANGTYTASGLPAGTYFVKTNGLNQQGTVFLYIDQVYKPSGSGATAVTGVPCNNSCKPSEFGQGVAISSGSGNAVTNASATGIDLALASGGSIAGTVTSSGNAVSGVSMSAFDANNPNSSVAFTSTAANGTYTLTGLPTGNYYVKAQPFGSNLIGQVYNGKTCLNCQSSSGDKVAVTAGSTKSSIDFALGSGGTITGTVKSAASGNPVLSGINVQLSTAASSFVTSAQTNAQGVFTLAGLPADTYYAKTTNTQGFIDKIYDNIVCQTCFSSSANGTPIVLAIGDTKTANFTLTKGAKVTGKVTDSSNGDPISGISVGIYNNTGQQVTSGQTNDAGDYQTQTGLAAGTYFAKTFSTSSAGSGYINKLYDNIVCVNCPVSGGKAINVTDSDVSGINFALAPGGRVTGTVVDANNNNPVQGVTVNIYNSQKDAQTNQVTFLGSGFTGANGAFAVTGLPGGTFVAKTSNNLGFIDEIYDDVKCGSCSVTTGKTFTVTVGGTTTLDLIKLDSGARITGTIVSSASGNPPIPFVSIGVYNESNQQVANTSTNQSGVYTTGGLPPGKYFVKTTFAQGYVPQLFDGKPCLSCQPASGTAITLSGTQVFTANFTLSAGASIAGQITEASTTNGDAGTDAPGGPLPGINVNVYDSGNTFITGSQTDSSGKFTLSGLAAGTYFVKTSNILGYIDKMYENVNCVYCSLTGGKGITVGATEAKTGIDMSLSKGGTISGSVADTNAAPLANIGVQLVGASGQFIRSATTDGLGKYSFGGLANGSFYVKTQNSLGYIDVLYKDINCASCNPTSGTPVKLTSTLPNAAGIDFALAVGGTVGGTVTALGGAPIDNMTVFVFKSAGGAPIASGFTNANGVYKTSGLPTGTFFVKTSNNKGFIDQLYDGKQCSSCNPASGTPVSVTTGQSTEGINFTLAPGGRVSGVVTSGGTPVVGANVNFFNGSGTSVANGFTDGTGSYIIFGGLPTGTYYAKTFNNSGLIDEIYDDISCTSCPVTSGKPISVTTGQTTTGVNFSLVSGSRIAGTVTDKGTGLPIANARVDVIGPTGFFVTSATTGSGGTYITSGGLAAGSYYLRASSFQGYVAKMYPDVDCPACAPFKGTAVTVAAGETKTGIDFTLTLGGLISGTITDAATGSPLGPTDTEPIGALIYDQNNLLVGSARADGAGRYTSGSGVPTGTYYVRTFNYQGYINKLYNLSGPCLGESGFNGKGSGLGAPSCIVNTGTPVSVTSGQTTSGIDFSLSKGLRLSGQVTDLATGLPIANAHVGIFDANGKGATGTETDGAGKFQTPAGLPPGTYYAGADASDQGYYGKFYDNLTCVGCSPTGGTAIAVSASKGDINFALEKGGSVSGTVKAADTNQPLGNLKLSFFSSTGTPLGSGKTNADGTFFATGVPPGSYFIRTFNLLGYVDQSYLNHACAPCPITQATPITVAANTTTTGIDFTLQKGGLVKGNVTDANTGAPIQGVSVAVYKQDGTTFVGRSAPTDENGYYSISLPVGTYVVKADPVPGFTPVATQTSSGRISNAGSGTVSISEGGEASVVYTLQSCTAPTIAPDTLGTLTIGTTYSKTITATGSNSPYTFSVSDGSLPPGLSLNSSTGVLSGTPTTRGTANFTIGASGTNDCSGTTSYAQVTLGVTLSSSSASLASAAGTGTIGVNAESATASWSASSDSSWLTISGGSSGTGSGTVSYAATANTSASSRTGTITIAGERFTVTQARTNRPRIAVDTPQNGQVVGRSFTAAGWALDLDSSTNSGVDAVHIYALPAVDGGFGAGVFLGAASVTSRADVANTFGSQFLNAGYSSTVTLAAGSYRLVVYARTALTGLFDAQQAVDITVTAAGANPAMAIDAPASGATVGESFIVGGWAVDRGATSGIGVDSVHIYAYPLTNGVPGSPTFLGIAPIGGERSDVGGLFGSQFTNSGFQLTGSGLSAGRYRIVAYARSTVTGTFNQSTSKDVTVDVPVPNPVMSIDTPSNGATKTQPFVLGGWAVDLGARSGSGVDAVHVWAFNASTGDSQFVGAASYGGTRGDVGAVYGSQFANSGYSLTVSDLPTGTYDLAVYSRSTLTGTFNLVKVVRVTIQ